MIIRMKMKKLKSRKITIILFILVLLFSLYAYFSAKKQQVTYFKGTNAQHIAYKELVTTMNSNSVAYFFCTKSNVDCRYIDKEMLDFLLIDANVERFENIFLVDTATMDKSVLPSSLAAHFGFSNIPAFALLSYENGSVVVHSVLQWTNSNPFTSLDLKEWMKENKLWLKEYTN